MDLLDQNLPDRALVRVLVQATSTPASELPGPSASTRPSASTIPTTAPAMEPSSDEDIGGAQVQTYLNGY